mgnify:CR=1 FL=1|tara:strand:+ start:349 stop:516 length:168 start_codon:yes stop_codon:yes gene_type:complete
MSRATQFLGFLNAKKMPNKEEKKIFYSSIEITKELKKKRTEYRKELRKNGEKANK